MPQGRRFTELKKKPNHKGNSKRKTIQQLQMHDGKFNPKCAILIAIYFRTFPAGKSDRRNLKWWWPGPAL